jgi:ergothioneine biosynthesis protein EgtB
MQNHKDKIVQKVTQETENTLSFFQGVRAFTALLTDHLSESDITPQSMEDASPVKWHLAHTTWFFETFILLEFAQDYQPFDESFGYLFNSYYEQAGPRHPRPFRGLITRPSAQAVRDYRKSVDEAMTRFLDTEAGRSEAVRQLVILGCHHEQQHQELILTDSLHLFDQNPLKPAFCEGMAMARFCSPHSLTEAHHNPWQSFEGGLIKIGHEEGNGFAYDHESPRHQFFLHPYRLAKRCVTQGDYLEFIEDGGYQTPTLWLADGWARVQAEGWACPLYWDHDGDRWHVMTLHGRKPLSKNAPVCQLSYFEADAFARWASARLPTEQEWEHAARNVPVEGNFSDSGLFQPMPVTPDADNNAAAMHQLYGDVWEWTCSNYNAYPGYQPPPGAVGEYNGKFMCGQFVLRGGSCATSPAHMRPTYRNFFYPHQRWQFSGLRLARSG